MIDQQQLAIAGGAILLLVLAALGAAALFLTQKSKADGQSSDARQVCRPAAVIIVQVPIMIANFWEDALQNLVSSLMI